MKTKTIKTRKTRKLNDLIQSITRDEVKDLITYAKGCGSKSLENLLLDKMKQVEQFDNDVHFNLLEINILLNASDYYKLAKENLSILRKGILKYFKNLKRTINIIDKTILMNDSKISINGNIVGSIQFEEKEDEHNTIGSMIVGHKSSIYLGQGSGYWYNDKGEHISGYLYYREGKFAPYRIKSKWYEVDKK